MPKDFTCPECGKERKNARSNAVVCSAGCRIKKLRRIKKEVARDAINKSKINRG